MITIDQLNIRIPDISNYKARQLVKEVSVYLSEHLSYTGEKIQIGDLHININLSSGNTNETIVRSIGDQIINNIQDKIIQNQNVDTST